MRRWISRSLFAVALLVALLGVTVVALVRGSLPTLDGEAAGAGLTGAVTIERDARGSVTLTGTTRADLAHALGYAHAQDRWFQMDLLRRAAAGELSALLGASTLDADRSLRVHRFRAAARAAYENAPAAERALLEAYARGANAGLASLSSRPWEYWLLRATPAAWLPEDSLLVVYAMFVDLQGANVRTERQRGLLAEALPPAVAEFLYAEAQEWSAALDGSVPPAPRLPAPTEYDLRTLGALDFAPPADASREHSPLGSNNFALAGERTATGTALVANDMHLGLRLPNTWYHARLRQVADGATALDVTGVTLPGAPAVVAGSNGRVAWAFTNSYGDYTDLVVLEPDPQDANRYLAADGPQAFTVVRETLAVNGGGSVPLDVRLTRWGPVIEGDAHGRPLALAWTAHRPGAVNLELLGLETATNVDEALSVGARAGIPGQNLVVGDRDGGIAWTVAGRIPERRASGWRPRASTEPDLGFEGWVAPERRPRIVDPEGGQIWTANSRVVGGEALAIIGDGGYDRGARAGQLRDALRSGGERRTARDALALMLDDRALFLARWRDLLARALGTAGAGTPERAELQQVLAGWSGHAAVDDAAYRAVRTFRMEVERRAYYALIAPARAAAPDARFRIPPSFEGPLWQLLTERPAHLLAPEYADWEALLLAAADATIARLREDCASLAACTWGERNTTRIAHPLSGALPFLRDWLDMPARALPGDNDLPRVQGPTFGASERFAVPVGHEADGVFHMPGGQSGHPWSRFYASWHAAWEAGEPTPFLPGPPRHALVLRP